MWFWGDSTHYKRAPFYNVWNRPPKLAPGEGWRPDYTSTAWLGVFGVINTLTIVGGRIQNQIKNINATTRNVFFDRRFAKNGFAPPWFPSTTVSQNGSNSANLTTSVQRVQW